MQIECSNVRFRIDIDFPDSDVDVSIAENWRKSQFCPFTSEFKHRIQPESRTPVGESVDFCLKHIFGCTHAVSRNKWEFTNHVTPLKELEKLHVDAVYIRSLCMGNCSIDFEVDTLLFSRKLVQEVSEIVRKIFKKHIAYYKS